MYDYGGSVVRTELILSSDYPFARRKFRLLGTRRLSLLIPTPFSALSSCILLHSARRSARARTVRKGDPTHNPCVRRMRTAAKEHRPYIANAKSAEASYTWRKCLQHHQWEKRNPATLASPGGIFPGAKRSRPLIGIHYTQRSILEAVGRPR
jgi:hypothetical protein